MSDPGSQRHVARTPVTGDPRTGGGAPYVEAIVVRCARPTIARAGDRAVVRADGTIEGFVGGSCADETVRLHALRALETGEAVLVRIVPGGGDGAADEEGAVVVANPCLSGGALEVFLQPHVPAPRVRVVGDSPIARALSELAPSVGFEVGGEDPFAVVVASLGHGDEEALRAALDSGAEYVGLVASRRRGAEVLAALGPGAERVHTPAGLDIGARTHAEIALSILAELVAARRRPALAPPPPAPVAAAPHACHAAHP
ncbi:MAG TPA: XdhC family protein [Solirubrobacteraceae bacterium]|jgi:xanthine dehydrogenase accessory factor